VKTALRLAVSLGGDSDTLTCITGGIAEAFYDHIPEEIINAFSPAYPTTFNRFCRRWRGRGGIRWRFFRKKL
jgi:ADP-ribosylglycohydrolase